MPQVDIGQFILFMVALIFSVSVHESAHAWMSDRFGDDLARTQGRVSLNPVTHIDPIGTLLFPTIAYFAGPSLLGWARPTPVNPLRWRNKRVANLWVSAAGIISNAIIAIIAAVIIRILLATGVLTFGVLGFPPLPLVPVGSDSEIALGAAKLLAVFFTLNVALAVFNLIPIPPLDGSKVLASILPESFEPAIESLERIGFLLLFVAVFTGAFGTVFRFVLPVAREILLIGYY